MGVTISPDYSSIVNRLELQIWLLLYTAVVRIGFNTTCYSSPSGTPTEVCLEIVNNIRLIMNKSMVLLAVDGSCRQTGVTFMNGDTTGSRACISIESFPMNVSIPNPPCQSISLLQRCQSETEESRQTVNFQQSTALSCISNGKFLNTLPHH